MEQNIPHERIRGIPNEILGEAALLAAGNDGLRARIKRELTSGGDPLLPLSFAGGEGSKAAIRKAHELRKQQLANGRKDQTN